MKTHKTQGGDVFLDPRISFKVNLSRNFRRKPPFRHRWLVALLGIVFWVAVMTYVLKSANL
jgi:hypothetical protein